MLYLGGPRKQKKISSSSGTPRKNSIHVAANQRIGAVRARRIRASAAPSAIATAMPIVAARTVAARPSSKNLITDHCVSGSQRSQVSWPLSDRRWYATTATNARAAPVATDASATRAVAHAAQERRREVAQSSLDRESPLESRNADARGHRHQQIRDAAPRKIGTVCAVSLTSVSVRKSNSCADITAATELFLIRAMNRRRWARPRYAAPAA